MSDTYSETRKKGDFISWYSIFNLFQYGLHQRLKSAHNVFFLKCEKTGFKC